MSQFKLFWDSVIREKDNEVKILFIFSAIGCLGAKLALVIVSTLIEFTVLSKFSPKQKQENLTWNTINTVWQQQLHLGWFSNVYLSPWCWNNLSLCFSRGDKSCKSIAGSLCRNNMERNITQFPLCHVLFYVCSNTKTLLKSFPVACNVSSFL